MPRSTPTRQVMDEVAARMRNRLDAVGALGGSRALPATTVQVDPAQLRLLLERTAKHLAVWALRAESARQA